MVEIEYKTLNYKGSSLSYTCTGKGAAVVFLHGFLETQEMWLPCVATFSKRFRVITIDLLGHGKTESMGYVHTMEDMAVALRLVLSYLRLRRITIVGHSMGGYVALAFAEKYPAMLKGLCLVNSTAQADTLERKKHRDRSIRAVKKNPKTFIRFAISNLFSQRSLRLLKEEVEELTDRAKKTSVRGVVAALEGMKNRKDRTAVLKRGDFKKIIVAGKQDQIIDYSSILNLAEETDTKLIVLSEGHLSPIENKYEFERSVLDFLR